jgi:hypothetical protein
MAWRGCSFTCLLVLARIASSAFIVTSRAAINLTSIPNTTSILENLDYVSNCTAATLWFNNLPSDRSAGSSNDPTNIAFLRSALPLQYQSSNDSILKSLYNNMSSEPLLNTGVWIIPSPKFFIPNFSRTISLHLI